MPPPLPADPHQEFIISREFNAPRAQVWAAWTQPERMQRWYGPQGFAITTCKMDLRSGGLFHYCLKNPKGGEMWGKFVFREIVAPELLVVINSFSDAAGGTIRHPMNSTWPLELVSITTFAEQGGRTTLTICCAPLNASTEERSTFAASHDQMTQGWAGTFEQLAQYLAQPQ